MCRNKVKIKFSTLFCYQLSKYWQRIRRASPIDSLGIEHHIVKYENSVQKSIAGISLDYRSLLKMLKIDKKNATSFMDGPLLGLYANHVLRHQKNTDSRNVSLYMFNSRGKIKMLSFCYRFDNKIFFVYYGILPAKLATLLLPTHTVAVPLWMSRRTLELWMKVCVQAYSRSITPLASSLCCECELQ